MTKAKGGSFAGAWMDGRIPDALIAARLVNEAGAKIDTAPVLAALSRQMEIWRFDHAWRNAEPQPAQWADRLRAITIPKLPTFREVIEINTHVRALPKVVLAALDLALFRAQQIGRVALFDRMKELPTGADADLLRDTLAAMLADLDTVEGKRGPRKDVGPALRAVVTALLAHSDLKPVAARNLAADLLRMAGIPAPENRGRLTELMKD